MSENNNGPTATPTVELSLGEMSVTVSGGEDDDLDAIEDSAGALLALLDEYREDEQGHVDRDRM